MYKYTMKKQRGIALVVSLIMLLLMTLLSVSSMKSTLLEEKMAGNYKSRNTAFQSAEAGLRAGETYLATTTILPLFNGTTAGLYQPTLSGNSRWNSVDWANAAEVVAYVGTLSDVAANPNYIIEELEPVAEGGGSLEVGTALENRFYRITTEAVGNTDNAVVMLQGTYKR
jgi:type IV pilus assembly protein PilX